MLKLERKLERNLEMLNLQADFGAGSTPQSPGGLSAVPSSPAASHSAQSPKGGPTQGVFKPPIMGISPPPTSSAKKAAQRWVSRKTQKLSFHLAIVFRRTTKRLAQALWDWISPKRCYASISGAIGY